MPEPILPDESSNSPQAATQSEANNSPPPASEPAPAPPPGPAPRPEDQVEVLKPPDGTSLPEKIDPETNTLMETTENLGELKNRLVCSVFDQYT